MKKTILFLSLLLALISTSRAEPVVALTSGNRLLFFDSATPGTVPRTFSLGNLISETLVGFDFRPATGDVQMLGASGRLYVLNLTTASFSIPNNNSPLVLTGTSFGFDFNPVVDRIRITSDADQNFRVDPNTGGVSGADNVLTYAATDAHAGANPNVVACAYTNNFGGATATVLYGIDSSLDTLVIQAPPNTGILRTVGPLGVDTSDLAGFDISQSTGAAYASLTVGGTTGLYTIDLGTGAATLVGNIAKPGAPTESVLDLALPTATRLLNISSRGRVGTGADVLIGGFIIRTGGRVALRAIGPSLAAFGVSDPLADPVLTLKDINGTTLGSNDNWQTANANEITLAGLAPTNDLESVILTSLPAGNYTGIVSGKNGGTGVALVEIYQLP